MPKAKTFLIADTETIGIGSRALVFDFGYVIATRTHDIIERSFLIREIITSPRYMFSAIADRRWRESFGGKLFTVYIPALHNNDMRLYRWREVKEILRDDMQTHGVDVFCAYNLGFDSRALQLTDRIITAQKKKVLTYKPDLLCLWNFACKVALNSPTYHRLARDRRWITDANNVRTTAEKAYAYLTGNFDFVEEHTALADAQIETEILRRLLAKKKGIPYNDPDLYMPWQHAQRIRGRLL